MFNVFSVIPFPTTEDPIDTTLTPTGTPVTEDGVRFWSLMDNCIQLLKIPITLGDVSISLWEVMIVGMFLSLGGWVLWRLLHPYDNDD